MQTRRGSILEAVVNNVVGYFLSILAQVIVFPLFGINIPLHTNFEIGSIFFIISLSRSFAIRRIFNYFIKRKVKKSVWKNNKGSK